MKRAQQRPAAGCAPELLVHGVGGTTPEKMLDDPRTARLTGGCGPEVDRAPLRDPPAYGRTARYPQPAPILGRFGYRADPAFAEERRRPFARLCPDLPAPRRGPAEAPEREPQSGPGAQGSAGRSSA